MYTMKRYTVSVVRERLSEALDAAERGEPVFIERRNVQYRLLLDTPKTRRKRREPLFEILDPAVAEGQWTWDWSPGHLKFRARRRPPGPRARRGKP